MKVLILGIDGYIGWPLAWHLNARGYEVYGIDDKSRRAMVHFEKSISATDILSFKKRQEILWANNMEASLIGVEDIMVDDLRTLNPDAIVHLAEMPSAPFSMADRTNCDHTIKDNVVGTAHLLWRIKEACPNAHLVKLGTMGEYGTPNLPIQEGEFLLTHAEEGKWKEKEVRQDRLLFPRRPGSFYHVSKVCDTYLIEFACRNWGLRSTDIMQGVLYGTRTEETMDKELVTRFDFDETFGTVINRFCVQQVLGLPLTPYGKGNQKRGFLQLRDSLQCIRLIIENPPDKGQYRTVNQFERVFSINQLAEIVKDVGGGGTIENIPNPRNEAEDHYYKPIRQFLPSVGYKPSKTMEEEISLMLKDLREVKGRIEPYKEVIIPKTLWS